MGCASSKGADTDAGAVRKDEPAKGATESAPAPQAAAQPAAAEPAAEPKKFVDVFSLILFLVFHMTFF